jgi:hypothetical protein
LTTLISRSRYVARALLVAVLSLTGLVALDSGTTPATSAALINPNCSWYFQLGGTQVNLTYPDAAARYWGALWPIPAGGHIEVKGQFPHARYFSLTSYNIQTQAIDELTDDQIVPDPGSVNPYVPGADRSAVNRSYTISVVDQRAPATGRAPNTVYTTNADGSKTASPVLNAGLGLRIYLPDAGTGDTAGVPLPTITFVQANGSRQTLPSCQILTLPTNFQKAIAAAGEAVPLTGPGVLARNPVHWRRYTNAVTAISSLALDNMLTGPLYDLLGAGLDKIIPTGGFFENPDGKYLLAPTSREFGQVLQLRGRMPTTPRTGSGEGTMTSGQLRYWSMCTFSQASSLYGCASDEDVPTRADGDFVVVATTAAARPSNARAACGVAWIPLGPVPQTFLMLRNMVPDPSFTHSIQRAEVGTEKATLGEYYPESTYFRTTKSFEALGCPVG